MSKNSEYSLFCFFFFFYNFSVSGACKLCCKNEKIKKGRMDSTHRQAGRGLNNLSSARFLRAVTFLGSGYLQGKILSVLNV